MNRWLGFPGIATLASGVQFVLLGKALYIAVLPLVKKVQIIPWLFCKRNGNSDATNLL